jgi:hypothetical protein
MRDAFLCSCEEMITSLHFEEFELSIAQSLMSARDPPIQIEALRRQIVEDVPRWSAFIRQEADRFGYTYVDMVSDFPQRLAEAEMVLTSDV